MQHEIILLRLISALSFGSVATALVSQYAYDMQPCAWCVFQRLVYLVMACFAWGMTLANPSRMRLVISSTCLATAAIVGMGSAWYQEKVAANTFSCAQTLADRIMTASGLDGVAPWLFGIYASCMDARVKLLGIEYAWWSLSMFFLLATLALITLKRLFR